MGEIFPWLEAISLKPVSCSPRILVIVSCEGGGIIVHTRGGYTLLELMIVVALISVLAGIGVPHLLSAKVTANEAAAMASLHALATAQAQFQASVRCDQDGDGIGEYAFFSEMTGSRTMREEVTLTPPVLSQTFRKCAGDGVVIRGGYRFRIYLPDENFEGVREVSSEAGRVDPDSAEAAWACIAWPDRYGASGCRSFRINQEGTLLSVGCSAFSGDSEPVPEGVFGDPCGSSLEGGRACGSGEFKVKWVVADR